MAKRKLKVRHKKKRPVKRRVKKIKKPSIKKIKHKKKILNKAVKAKKALKPELKPSKKVGFFGRLFGAKPKKEIPPLRPLLAEKPEIKKKKAEKLAKKKEALTKKREALLKKKEMLKREKELTLKKKMEILRKKKEAVKKKQILRKKAAEEKKKRLLEKKKEEVLRKKRETVKKRKEMLKGERQLILKRKKELLLKRKVELMLKKKEFALKKKALLKKKKERMMKRKAEEREKREKLKKLKEKKSKKAEKKLLKPVIAKPPRKKAGFFASLFGTKSIKPEAKIKSETKPKEIQPFEPLIIEKPKLKIKKKKILKEKKRPKKITKTSKPKTIAKKVSFLSKLFGAEKEKPPEIKPLEKPEIKEIFPVPEKPEVLTERKVHVPEIKMELKKEKKVVKSQKIESEERPHLKLNIPGFDVLLTEGIPTGNSVLIEGGPGVGKTIFCLQTAYNLCKQGKKVLYMSFEEPEERLKSHMRNFGWDVDELERKGLIRIKRFDALDVARSVEALLSEAKKELLIEVHPMMFPRDFDPDILCVDSLTSIASAFTGEESRFRIYMEQLFRYLERTSMTSFLIRECSNPAHIGQIYVEKFEAISFLSDGIIIMYNVIYENGERGSALEILKMRGEKIDRRLVKMGITKKGLVIYPKADITDTHHIKYSLT